LVCSVGSVFCFVQPFGEEGYGKDQVTENMQKKVGKDIEGALTGRWVKVLSHHLGTACKVLDL